jgi:hypothetical protein
MSNEIEWQPNPGAMPCPKDMWVLLRYNVGVDTPKPDLAQKQLWGKAGEVWVTHWKPYPASYIDCSFTEDGYLVAYNLRGLAGGDGGAGGSGGTGECVVAAGTPPVDVEALRDLYRRRDRLAEEVAAVDREIKAKAVLWAEERRMFGLGPDGVRRMLFQPY